MSGEQPFVRCAGLVARKAAERKERDRIRARERRQRKKPEAAGVTFIDKPRGYRNKPYPVEE